jgi:hypothetical protein
MEFLLGLLGTGGLGPVLSGISGLIGGWLTKRENRKMAQLEHAHEVQMAQIDQKAAEFELQASLALAEKQIDLTQTEGDVERDIIEAQSVADVERNEAEAFRYGLQEAMKPTGHSGVDKFRALTRPLITWSLYAFVLAIFVVLHLKVGDLVAEDTELLIKLYVYLVQSVIYLFIMAVSWWFMSRGEKSAKTIQNLIS